MKEKPKPMTCYMFYPALRYISQKYNIDLDAPIDMFINFPGEMWTIMEWLDADWLCGDDHFISFDLRAYGENSWKDIWHPEFTRLLEAFREEFGLGVIYII